MYLCKSATTAAGSGSVELRRRRSEAAAAAASRRREKAMPVDLGGRAMVPWQIRWARAKMQWDL